MKLSSLACKVVLGVMAGMLLLQVEAQPAPKAPLCAVCPDPARDIGPDNLPPMEKTGAYFWVSTEQGVDLVRDRDWNADVPEVRCRRCPNPFGGPSWSNLPVSGDDQEFVWVRKVRDGARMISAGRNPNWTGEPSSHAEEEPEEDDDVVKRPLDRGGSVYHVTEQDVFRQDLLRSIGGVLSQSIVEIEEGGHFPTVELGLGPDGEYPGHIIVNGSSLSGLYRIRYEELVPMALFVDSGGTSLFTLWGADKLPDDFAKDAGFVEATDGRGHVAIEFAGTRYENVLVFLDICRACAADTKDRESAQLVQRLDAGEDSTSVRPSNYINSDVGGTFRLVGRDAGRVAVTGSVSRFYWSAVSDAVQAVSVDTIRPIVSAQELRSKAKQVLQLLEEQLSNRALEDQYILLLMQGIDVLRPVRAEASLEARRMLADAFYLFETLALLRVAKRNAPDQWSAFVAALSSDWLVVQHPEPWERYTKTWRRVFQSKVSGD
ncbi:MAG: hypothetical protein OXQ86_08855 [Gammaproteobacteria bacterium]|nr:hypothetical protein [Gammaproteobacteria bacterium]MDE0414032.1 hypothetical protein [Gammaproteobacteria bacterium]